MNSIQDIVWWRVKHFKLGKIHNLTEQRINIIFRFVDKSILTELRQSVDKIDVDHSIQMIHSILHRAPRIHVTYCCSI